MKHYLFAMLFVACTGCIELTNGQPMPTQLTDQHECIPACANLQKLGCEEGNPILTKNTCTTSSDCPKGQTCSGDVCTVSCAQFCIESENAGVWLQPKCASQIVSCNQLQACEEK